MMVFRNIPHTVTRPYTVLGKPETYISIQYNYNECLSFAGTLDPAFLLVIVSFQAIYHIIPYLLRHVQTSLDNLTPDANEKYSAALFDYFKEKLNVKGNRGYMYVFCLLKLKH